MEQAHGSGGTKIPPYLFAVQLGDNYRRQKRQNRGFWGGFIAKRKIRTTEILFQVLYKVWTFVVAGLRRTTKTVWCVHLPWSCA